MPPGDLSLTVHQLFVAPRLLLIHPVLVCLFRSGHEAPNILLPAAPGPPAYHSATARRIPRRLPTSVFFLLVDVFLHASHPTAASPPV